MELPAESDATQPLAQSCFLCAKSDFSLFDAAGSERLIFKAFFMKLSLDNLVNKICSTCWYHVKLLAEFRQAECEGYCKEGCFWSSVMNGNNPETTTRQSIYMAEVEMRYHRYVYSFYVGAKKYQNRQLLAELFARNIAMHVDTVPPKLVENDPKLFKCRVRLIIDRTPIIEQTWRKRKAPKSKSASIKELLKSPLEVAARFGERTSAREASRFKVPDVIFSQDVGVNRRSILVTSDRKCQVHGTPGGPSSSSKKNVQWSTDKVFIEYPSYKNDEDSDDEDDSIDEGSDSDSDPIPKKRKKFNTSPETVPLQNGKNKKKNSTKAISKVLSKSPSHKVEKKEVLTFKLNVSMPAKRKLKLHSRRLEEDYLRQKFGRKMFSANVRLSTLNEDILLNAADEPISYRIATTPKLNHQSDDIIMVNDSHSEDEVEFILGDDPKSRVVDESKDVSFQAPNTNITSIVDSLASPLRSNDKVKAPEDDIQNIDNNSDSLDSNTFTNGRDKITTNQTKYIKINGDKATKDDDDSNSSLERVATPPPPVNGIKTKAASKELPPILPVNGSTNILDTDDIFNLILSSPSTHNGQVKVVIPSDSVRLASDDTASIEDLLPSLNSDNSNSASITATECPMVEDTDSMLGLPLDFLDSL